MEKKFLLPTLIALIGFAIFLAISIITKVYHDVDLPIQIMGALLGAIITAFITMILLHGQSSAEELKERNVRLFEEKTERYKNFINLLWEVWEDRKITLQELHELLGAVTKDIMIFTKRVTTKKILDELNKISEYTKLEKIDDEAQKKMQESVFNIINILAEEMNLGGKIGKRERILLNNLEEKVLPYLKMREYKKKFLEEFSNKISESDIYTINSSTPYFKTALNGDEYIFINIGNSPVSLTVGPVSVLPIPERNNFTRIAFYVEYHNHRQYYPYRDATKGYRKDLLTNCRFLNDELRWIDLNKMEYIKKLEASYNDSNNDSDAAKLAGIVIDFYKNWNIEGKNIEAIIEECGDKI